MPNIASLKHHLKHADKLYALTIHLGAAIQTAHTQIYGNETDFLIPKKTMDFNLSVVAK